MEGRIRRMWVRLSNGFVLFSGKMQAHCFLELAFMDRSAYGIFAFVFLVHFAVVFAVRTSSVVLERARV